MSKGYWAFTLAGLILAAFSHGNAVMAFLSGGLMVYGMAVDRTGKLWWI